MVYFFSLWFSNDRLVPDEPGDCYSVINKQHNRSIYFLILLITITLTLTRNEELRCWLARADIPYNGADVNDVAGNDLCRRTGKWWWPCRYHVSSGQYSDNWSELSFGSTDSCCMLGICNKSWFRSTLILVTGLLQSFWSISSISCSSICWR